MLNMQPLSHYIQWLCNPANAVWTMSLFANSVIGNLEMQHKIPKQMIYIHIWISKRKKKVLNQEPNGLNLSRLL